MKISLLYVHFTSSLPILLTIFLYIPLSCLHIPLKFHLSKLLVAKSKLKIYVDEILSHSSLRQKNVSKGINRRKPRNLRKYKRREDGVVIEKREGNGESSRGVIRVPPLRGPHSIPFHCFRVIWHNI